MNDLSDEGSEDCPLETGQESRPTIDCRQLVVAPLYRVHDLRLSLKPDEHGDEDHDDDDDLTTKSLIDHAWSGRVLRLIGNKAKLMESFSWLSTVGGGYSALGERDSKFSTRAGALSLGQQLQIADQLGDERLKVMCHLFAALAALQLNNKGFCLDYIQRVIIPLINAMPYRDPIIANILRHICFRMSILDKYMVFRNNAIEGQPSDQEAHDLSTKQ